MSGLLVLLRCLVFGSSWNGIWSFHKMGSACLNKDVSFLSSSIFCFWYFLHFRQLQYVRQLVFFCWVARLYIGIKIGVIILKKSEYQRAAAARCTWGDMLAYIWVQLLNEALGLNPWLPVDPEPTASSSKSQRITALECRWDSEDISESQRWQHKGRLDTLIPGFC